MKTGQLAGVVPEIDERDAARFNGYTWKEWQEFSLLDPDGRYQRASGIAYYRLCQFISMHTDDAVNSEMDRRSKRG